MGAGWVAGVTRARSMAVGRLGPDAARELAASATLTEALRALANTRYRKVRETEAEAEAAAAGRAVSAALLWQLRVLAGWQPRAGVAALRRLAAGFEIANTRDHLRALAGEPRPAPYRLGALATAWPRLARTSDARGVRAVLTASPWGDPGGESATAVLTGMRLSAAAGVVADLPQAARWAAGDTALLLARESYLLDRPPTGRAAGYAGRILGRSAVKAVSYDDFRARLPSAARWALKDTGRPADLWRAEARWWAAVERDGLEMLHKADFGVTPVVGAVAVLSADAWRLRAALLAAAHEGRAREAFDDLLE
ncbi:hypothetical protein ACFY2T_25135 [Streptomyces sp. NPDC001260]|uniref:hypothetical protein n=1 Tax=Streptomyces sp. NPDC001260 TaxID=3364551 RepID=UPI00369A505D